ncbi:MAG: glycosyltransferase involved in cell wall biosynthesis [Halieaceae bacterium]
MSRRRSSPDSLSIALIAPSPVPFALGGAENLWTGWLAAMNSGAHIQAELIKLPSPEQDFWSIVGSYRQFAALDLNHFDRVISTKYPAWMVAHRDHHVFVQHKLRGLYDTWPEELLTAVPPCDSAALRRTLAALGQSRGARSALPEIFGALEELRGAAPSLPRGLFSLPGALIRRVVHSLDAIGLSRNAIRRYAAISRTVAERADYFPADVDVAREVQVIHHPTLPRQALDDALLLPEGCIFSASRLDGPKRMDWLIAAHQQADIQTPLYIAGDGPQRAQLEAQAAASDKIKLLGRLSDGALASAYQQASFVAYVPDREDYGLITLEALQAGCPVLTCSDSGGVTELVTHERNGLVTAPSIAALGAGMQRMAEDDALRARLAGNARQSVSHIDWPALVAQFSRPMARIAVINTFSFHPARSGGQLRMRHLYGELARRADVRCVNLVPAGNPCPERTLGPGLAEVRIPMSEEHSRYQLSLERRLDASCFDVAALLRPELTPAWVEAVEAAASWAEVIVFSHPYGFSALREPGAALTVYEAHNVEADLKAGILGAETPELAEVRRLEGECARRAAAVLCCSAADGARLGELYALDAKPIVVSNGVEAQAYPTLSAEQQAAARERLGVSDSALALFVGSLHGPNLDAALHIVDLARARPDWQFCLLGSVCEAGALARSKRDGTLPANLQLIGRVNTAELRAWLAVANVGLNPINSGSGTNLKLLEYAAAGLPILTTPFGGRGGLLHADEHFLSRELGDFPLALDTLHPTRVGSTRHQRVAAARDRAQSAGDWRQIASGMWKALTPLLCE